MRKSFASLCAFFIAIAAIVTASIVETPHFRDIKNYIQPKTLVILDIDDTLMIPKQTLGSDVWFLYRMQQHVAQGMDANAALERALAEWEAIRHLTEVQIVEEGSASAIAEMQSDKVPIICLTTQGLALATRTIAQLHMLAIDVTKTAPSKEDHYFMNGQGVLYRQGVLFTSGTAKGPALLKLLDVIGYYPERIVFINDKATHLRDVEQSMEARGIEFIGLRYSFSDNRVANFNAEIAEVQWQCSSFEHLLSDEEAKALLH